jgi:1-acyl-sn-glycerol-3-phosphate acyltransferase
MIKVMMRITAALYFEKVSIKGRENIPENGPCIFACNHPNSFLDALIITAYYRQPIFYIARGDAFKKPFGAKLLGFLNNLPIYRKEEGTGNIIKNRETMDYCLEVLKKGDTVLIFSEGLCENEWYLRPLRKGTARLVYEALHDNELMKKIKVIPVATNYSGWFGAGNKTYVEFLKPLALTTLIEVKEEQGLFLRKFNEELTLSLITKCISIDKKSDIKSQNLVTGFLLKNTQYGVEEAKKVINKFNSPAKSDYKMKLLDFEVFIQEKNIHYYCEKRVTIFSFFFSLLIIPVAFILNVLPYSVCKYIAEKTTRRNVFFDSVFFGSALLLGTIYMLLLTLCSAFILHSCLGLAASVIALTSAALYENAKRNFYCFITGKNQRIVSSMLKDICGINND